MLCFIQLKINELLSLIMLCPGTMSGGGGRVSKGRMCSSFVSDVTPEQLSRMERTMEKENNAVEVGSQTDCFILCVCNKDHMSALQINNTILL